MRLALLSLAAVCVYADSIDIEITPARKMIVHERFTQPGAALIYLASPCARPENIRSADGRVLSDDLREPWSTVSASPIPGEFSYEAAPSGSPRACSLPLLMPEHAIGSVQLTMVDHGSGVTRVVIPHVDGGSGKWTGTFPAVPSQVRIEWATGAALSQSGQLPTGWFAWNFWGLVSILVLWTAAYLVWAHRRA